MNVYSIEKLARHPETVAKLARNLQPAPITATLVVSDLCNQSCDWCTFRMVGQPSNELFAIVEPDGTRNNNPPRQIPAAKAFEILDDLAAMGTRSIIFSGGGEPSVHNNLPEIIDHCIERGMLAGVISNGVRWSGRLLESLGRCAWVRVSIDAANAATYSRMRKVSAEQFERAWRNIANLVALRDAGKSRATVGAGFVVTAENWQEVVAFSERARTALLNSVRISALFQPEGSAYFHRWGDDAKIACDLAEGKGSRDFEVYNLFAIRSSDFGRPDYRRCFHQEEQTFIGADLGVYRCCTQSYNRHGLIGSLDGRRFSEVWESQAKRDDFATFDARSCATCQHNGKNRASRRIVQESISADFDS